MYSRTCARRRVPVERGWAAPVFRLVTASLTAFGAAQPARRAVLVAGRDRRARAGSGDVVYRYSMSLPPEVRERRLQDVFRKDDPELSARIARLGVLFEDLRVEYHGSRTDADLPLDALSKRYRRFYFLRRSLVTLDEFGGALNRLNALRPWRDLVTDPGDAERRRMWGDAITFFNAKKARFAAIRGDIGAHYPESAAMWAVDHFHPDTVGALEIVYGEQTADAKLHFALELVGSVMLRTAADAGHQLTEEQVDDFIRGVFDDVTGGWQHAVNAVHVVIAEFLGPRFRRAAPDDGAGRQSRPASSQSSCSRIAATLR